jgi:hypothetical protein
LLKNFGPAFGRGRERLVRRGEGIGNFEVRPKVGQKEEDKTDRTNVEKRSRLLD